MTDVFTECMPRLEPVDDDVPALDALRELVGQLARSLADPQWQRLLPALILLRSQSDEMAGLDEEMRVSQQDLATEVFRRAVEERVLDPDVLVDPERTGLMLVGPLLAVALVDGAGIDDAFVDEVVTRFVRACAPR
ncbi:MAG: TetR/AcrR family transcriptional regulator C-terminal ligand-binding domain-containing protein [Microthrixaceae bacterium]|nr:TetR/AcrR family transcriptional regulator C-terminal ligand-binding domain-containing protein [Microthrixaceae bacterium]